MTRSKEKQRRSAISLETKILILDCLAKGKKFAAFGKSFNLGESTIRAIKKNEVAIRHSVISGTALSAKVSSYARSCLIEKTEKALVIWIQELTQKRIPVDGNLIKSKALRLYQRLKDAEPSLSTVNDSKSVFTASTGWLTRFLKRNAYHNLKIKGEIASADAKSAKAYPDKVRQIIKDGGYCSDQIFNADEIGLFWKKCLAAPISRKPKSQQVVLRQLKTG